MRKLYKLYLSYMKFTLTVMFYAAICFYVYSLFKAIGPERVLEAFAAAKIDAWFPVVMLMLVLYVFREQLGRLRR